MNYFINLIKNKFGETSTHLLKTSLIYGFIALSLIITKTLIARFYGQEALGIFTYFFSMVSFIFLFTSSGFPEAITQVIIKEPHQLKTALKYSLKYMLPFTIFFILLTYLVDQTIKTLIVSFSLYIITYTFFYLTYSIFRGCKKFAEGSFYSLLNRIIFILLIILLYFLTSTGFDYILLSMSLALLIAALPSLPQIFSLWKRTKNEPIDKHKFLLLSFSLFLMQVGFYSLRYVDVIIIKYLVDFNSLGLYSAYGSVTNIIRLIASVLPVIILPMAVISKYKLKQSLIKILKILLPFSIIILVLTYILVPILYGQEYKTIYLPLALVISSTLLVIYAYFNSVFVGENQTSRFCLKIIGIDFTISLIINTALTFLLVYYWGLIGAPIATSITIIFKIWLNSYAIKKMRLKNESSI